MDPKIASAEHVSLEDLRLAMNGVFSDYTAPMQLTRQSIAFMLKQRGFDHQASRVALVEGHVAAVNAVADEARFRAAFDNIGLVAYTLFDLENGYAVAVSNPESNVSTCGLNL